MAAGSLTSTCAFSTPRLTVAGWHTFRLDRPQLADVVAELLTPATTRALPPAWHGEYSRARAASWIAERDEESSVLLILDRGTAQPLGLVILAERAHAGCAELVDLRVGYLLAESAWGHGLASELMGGLVTWCRDQPAVRSIAGGVAADNPASARVLVKNGFVPAGPPVEGEQLYELSVNA